MDNASLMDEVGMMDDAKFFFFCYMMDEGDFFPLQKSFVKLTK